MASDVRINPIHRSLNKPLTILGVERKLFFAATVIGAATFNYFGSLLGGIAMFLVLFLVARLATAKDPQLPRILLNSSRFSHRYDPAKRSVVKEGRN